MDKQIENFTRRLYKNSEIINNKGYIYTSIALQLFKEFADTLKFQNETICRDDVLDLRYAFKKRLLDLAVGDSIIVKDDDWLKLGYSAIVAEYLGKFIDPVSKKRLFTTSHNRYEKLNIILRKC